MGKMHGRSKFLAGHFVAPLFLFFFSHVFWAMKFSAHAKKFSKTGGNLSSIDATFFMSTIRLNSKLKLFPKTLPIKGSFLVSFKTTENTSDGSPFVRHLSALVKSSADESTLTECVTQFKSDKPLYTQHVEFRWMLSPVSLHCEIYNFIGGSHFSLAPSAANVSQINATTLVNSYFITFHLNESNFKNCVEKFEICEGQNNRFPFQCNPQSTVETHSNFDCLQRIEFDSRCCGNCKQFCSENDNFPTPENFPIGKFDIFPTPPPFFVNSMPQANLTAESKNDAQSIVRLLGEQTKHLNEKDENVTDFSTSNISSQNICDSKPCLNNGLCILNNTYFGDTTPANIQIPTTFHCRCVGPFFGPLCQSTNVVDHCENVKCLNGATCYSLNLTASPHSSNTSMAESFQCLCRDGFTGPFCESSAPPAPIPLPPIFVDPCTPNPCQNNGTCLPLRLNSSDGDLTTAGHAQRRVVRSTALDPLLGSVGPVKVHSSPRMFPPTNRSRRVGPSTDGIASTLPFSTFLTSPGHLNLVPRDFFCQCPDEWAGNDLCGLPSLLITTITTGRPDTTNPLNSTESTPTRWPDCRRDGGATCGTGRCESDGTCHCTNSGFTGKFCDKDVDECENSPCKNNATCTNTLGSFNCTCTAQFSGPLCLVPLPGSKGGQADNQKVASSNVGAIVGGVLGCLALIGLSVGGYFLYKYVSRSRKLKGKYNPAREEMNNVGGHPVPMATLSTGERLI